MAAHILSSVPEVFSVSPASDWKIPAARTLNIKLGSEKPGRQSSRRLSFNRAGLCLVVESCHFQHNFSLACRCLQSSLSVSIYAAGPVCPTRSGSVCPSIKNVDQRGAQVGFARLPREVSGGQKIAHLLQPVTAVGSHPSCRRRDRPTPGRCCRPPRVDRTGEGLSIAPRCRPHCNADDFPGQMPISARRHSPSSLTSARCFCRSKSVSGGTPIALSGLLFEKTMSIETKCPCSGLTPSERRCESGACSG